MDEQGSNSVTRIAPRIVNDPPESIDALTPLHPKEVAKIRRQERQQRFQVASGWIRLIVAALILLMVMYYTGSVIMNPEASVDMKHLAFAVWGGLVGGAVGYMFGHKG